MSFSRCLRFLCPVCGQGRLFVRWSQIRSARDFFLPPEKCDSCGFQFGREPGYYFGVVTPILPILAVFTGIIFSAITYFLSHGELESVLTAGAAGLFVGFFVFFRTAIAIYVALDHTIAPPGDPDSRR